MQALIQYKACSQHLASRLALLSLVSGLDARYVPHAFTHTELHRARSAPDVLLARLQPPSRQLSQLSSWGLRHNSCSLLGAPLKALPGSTCRLVAPCRQLAQQCPCKSADFAGGETKELTAQLADADATSMAEGLAMLKGFPGIRESGDLGRQDSVPRMMPSVFSPAGPASDDLAAELAASDLESAAGMARDDSANVSSEAWLAGARSSGPKKLSVSRGWELSGYCVQRVWAWCSLCSQAWAVLLQGCGIGHLCQGTCHAYSHMQGGLPGLRHCLGSDFMLRSAADSTLSATALLSYRVCLWHDQDAGPLSCQGPAWQ